MVNKKSQIYWKTPCSLAQRQTQIRIEHSSPTGIRKHTYTPTYLHKEYIKINIPMSARIRVNIRRAGRATSKILPHAEPGERKQAKPPVRILPAAQLGSRARQGTKSLVLTGKTLLSVRGIFWRSNDIRSAKLRICFLWERMYKRSQLAVHRQLTTSVKNLFVFHDTSGWLI